MPFVIALVIIALFCFASVKFRCYACFNLVMIGTAAVIAGDIRGESMFTIGGAVFLIGGLLIMYITSLKVEKSRRIHYMFNLFLCGMFYFLRLMMIMLIILIPFASLMSMLAKGYEERVLVDLNGHRIGTVYVDEHNEDPYGNKYNPHDPY